MDFHVRRGVWQSMLRFVQETQGNNLDELHARKLLDALDNLHTMPASLKKRRRQGQKPTMGWAPGGVEAWGGTGIFPFLAGCATQHVPTPHAMPHTISAHCMTRPYCTHAPHTPTHAHTHAALAAAYAAAALAAAALAAAAHGAADLTGAAHAAIITTTAITITTTAITSTTLLASTTLASTTLASSTLVS